MSALFDEDEESGAEKLKRAGAPGRTILAALPNDRDGEIDLTSRQVVAKRFPHRQMPTYERVPSRGWLEMRVA